MNKVYYLLKLNRYIQSRRLKNLGIYFLHIFGKRYVGIFLDPVLACNLRCKMCYFSDEEKRKTLKGKFSIEQLQTIAGAFFHRALKVQIGCGAEPSLFKYNRELILLAKSKKVPYISMTTNGVLFTEEDLWSFVEAGLNEITLSLHGVTKETYEYFMTGASYEAFCNVLNILSEIKKKYPDFKIRINYTINKDNLQELSSFFDVFGKYSFDIIQMRPIVEMGNSEYNNFSWTEIYEDYDRVIQLVKQSCAERDIVCLAPDRNDLIKETNDQISVAEQTYINISPRGIWESDFDIEKDTFESYSKRVGLGKKYFRKVFEKKEESKNKRNLNYNIQ
ncbi:radical SAM protein [Paludibacter sp. 221]|uniref:radical SAM protein n=1 Tax=Paludibacter sp. 221 TaxID=2302939 RepID=UPI0013CF9726|nr:radical SAM protein [Paludibacter sp. 221]NDV47435.1 radical SAM protein [Paludibacter sp. 221]